MVGCPSLRDDSDLCKEDAAPLLALNRPDRRQVLKALTLGLAGAPLAGAWSRVTAIAADGPFKHALAMHGDPAYPPGFAHFRYARPDSPKGGRLTFGQTGTFDSINPFVLRGTPFQQVRGYVIESLMTRGMDEAFSVYGLIANSIETDSERTFVTFSLDPRARFSDGRAVSAEDVLFSWQLLREKGRPNHRLYYGKVTRAEQIAEDRVRFDFGTSGDRELPLILALMPVLPRHAVDQGSFDEPSLAVPTGSGPYTVAELRPGDFVRLTRNPRYWGADLPANRGHYNFDELRFEFYRDNATWFEAFKRKLYDFRIELDPGRWQGEYDFPAARRDALVKDEVEIRTPKPFSALVFNTRRTIFADPRVREALIELFDFEWMNAKLFFSSFKRTASFFEGSALSARGRPASEAERALLAPFAKDILTEVMAGTYAPPVSDGSGQDRAHLRRALALLASGGWKLRAGKLVHEASGEAFTFEILVATRDDERLATVYATHLVRAGIAARVRLVDGMQFEARRQSYDFDMIPFAWGQSLSPGNEQHFYFGSASADRPGTRNYMGMKSKAADTMIEALLQARTPEELETAARALDRVLMSGRYVIPLFHLPKQWMARWPHIERPEAVALYGHLPETWWHREARP
jgi:peptide/nickel transport system substrate-binding protein